MATEVTRWNATNFLGDFDTRLVLTNATLNADKSLTILAGGNATLELVDEVNIEFKYYRLVNVFASTAVSTANNYKSGPTIGIQEVYKDNANVPLNTRVRAVGFNTTKFDSVSSKYTDESVCSTLNRKMSKMRIVIQNDTNATLTIYSLSAYQSEDVSVTAVNRVMNTVQKSISAKDMKVYRNSDGSINGIGIIIPGTTVELMFRPSYFNGQLIAIDTNFGQTVSVQNVLGQITFLGTP